MPRPDSDEPPRLAAYRRAADAWLDPDAAPAAAYTPAGLALDFQATARDIQTRAVVIAARLQDRALLGDPRAHAILHAARLADALRPALPDPGLPSESLNPDVAAAMIDAGLRALGVVTDHPPGPEDRSLPAP